MQTYLDLQRERAERVRRYHELARRMLADNLDSWLKERIAIERDFGQNPADAWYKQAAIKDLDSRYGL